MSNLFESGNLGPLILRNRFIQAATYEALATEDGHMTDGLVNRYRELAQGEVGLCIPGHMYVHPYGRAARYQVGIHDDACLPGLARLAKAVHEQGGQIAFQLSHAGRQTTRALIGRRPLGASAIGRDPIHRVSPAEMTEGQLQTVIAAFGQAAGRAAAAGADAVQLQAAHGQLINQFLSPFFNQRRDRWGGSAENRFRFLGEVIAAVRHYLPPDRALLVKLNLRDYTPKPGLKPQLVAGIVRRLARLEIDGLELTSGVASYSPLRISRGQVPIEEFVALYPWYTRPFARRRLRGRCDRYVLKEGYNIEDARLVQDLANGTPIVVVGGLRRLTFMERLLEIGPGEFVALARPFIREPDLVRRFRQGQPAAACQSCNRCVAAVAADQPLFCRAATLDGLAG